MDSEMGPVLIPRINSLHIVHDYLASVNIAVAMSVWNRMWTSNETTYGISKFPSEINSITEGLFIYVIFLEAHKSNQLEDQ